MALGATWHGNESIAAQRFRDRHETCASSISASSGGCCCLARNIANRERGSLSSAAITVDRWGPSRWPK
jgi:hypothetical protein